MKPLLPVAILLTGAIPLLAQSFAEDFESHPVGKPIPAGAGMPWTSNNDNNNRHAKIRAQAFQAFGSGKYLVIDQARAQGGPLVLGANGSIRPSGTALEVSFEARTEGGLGSGVAFFLGAGNMTSIQPDFPQLDEATGQKGPRWRDYAIGLQFNGSKLGGNTRRGTPSVDFPVGRSVKVRLVVNNGTEAISYPGGSVAPQRYDLHLDGTLVADDREFEGRIEAGRALDSFSFIGNNTGKPPLGRLMVDELLIRVP